MLATLAIPRLLRRLVVGRDATPRPAAGRRAARRALACGLLAFCGLTVGVEAAAETARPEWRDPEYGQRLRQVRQRQHKRHDRPLVLFFGSSRAQMGVSPHAMGFPDEPGQPLAYNFGYRSAHPLGVCLQVNRMFDDGVKPAAVLVMIAAVESKVDGAAEEEFPKWGPRFSSADLRRLAPYTKNPAVYRRDLAAARRNPWAARREAILSDYLPNWQLPATRHKHEGWERMDRYGFTPFPQERLTDDIRRTVWDQTRAHHTEVINKSPPGVASHQAMRDLVARCRDEGAAVAMVWAPESPAYRALYAPAGWAGVEAYTRMLTAELGVPVFPAPDHLEEDDFADGIHMLPDGAARYSRWLAETHLKPWLAEVLKSR